jgi:hypothetical protein
MDVNNVNLFKGWQTRSLYRSCGVEVHLIRYGQRHMECAYDYVRRQ